MQISEGFQELSQAVVLRNALVESDRYLKGDTEPKHTQTNSLNVSDQLGVSKTHSIARNFIRGTANFSFDDSRVHEPGTLIRSHNRGQTQIGIILKRKDKQYSARTLTASELETLHGMQVQPVDIDGETVDINEGKGILPYIFHHMDYLKTIVSAALARFLFLDSERVGSPSGLFVTLYIRLLLLALIFFIGTYLYVLIAQ